MAVGAEKNLPSIPITSPEAKNAMMKAVVGDKEGWQDHVLRIVELDKAGYTPKHAHPWPHINYMIEGTGILHLDGKDEPVEPGSYAYVPPDTMHQFRNTGDQPFRFICIVPKSGHVV